MYIMFSIQKSMIKTIVILFANIPSIPVPQTLSV